MFETLSYMMLQQYCWIVVSLLGGAMTLLIFVQGGQILVYTVGKTQEECKLIVNSLGRKWALSFAGFAAFAVMLFASFPLFCATSFGGARLLWLLISLCFLFQTALFEMRWMPAIFPVKKVYEFLLFFTGITGMILLGTGLGMFFNGAMFSLNDVNITRWETPYRGIEAILNPHNLLLGVTVFFLSRVLALLYFINCINNEQIITRSKIRLFRNAITFSICFFGFIAWLLMKDGFYYDPSAEEQLVSMQAHKYLHNLLAMPAVLALLLAGITLVFAGIIRTMINSRFKKGIWYTGAGAVMSVMALLLTAGFNNTSYYPSLYDIQDSLTIENSSSGYFMLAAMSYISLTIPIIALVTFWLYQKKKKSQEKSCKKN